MGKRALQAEVFVQSLHLDDNCPKYLLPVREALPLFQSVHPAMLSGARVAQCWLMLLVLGTWG